MDVFLLITAIGFTVLAVVTCTNLMRLRRILMGWAGRRRSSYPVFPALFVLSLILGAAVLIGQDRFEHPVRWAAYGWIGLCWGVTAWFNSRNFITDHGIVKNLNIPAQTVPWTSITDYTEHPETRGTRFVFFYSDGDLHRLELFVPTAMEPAFRKHLGVKFRHRFAPATILTESEPAT